MPPVAALAQAPAANCASDTKCPAPDPTAPDPTAAAPIRVDELANQTSQCAPARGPIALGSMEEAVRSAPTSIRWNDLEPSRSMWASFEYLGVWVKSSHVPSPATSSPIGAPQSRAGMPGQLGAAIMSGDDRLNTDMRSGGRITAGAWVIPNAISVEASFFTVQPETAHFWVGTAAGVR
jgi:hypothetical protein